MTLGIAHRFNATGAAAPNRLEFGFFGWLNTQGLNLYVTGPETVSIAGTEYAIDTSFEPYRREAFRHRSLPDMRESLNFDNVPGEGVVNTSGYWRRDAIDWSLGAGQLYFDHKKSADQRFYKSKGVDPFTNQWQLGLLNDTTLTMAMQGARTNVKALAVSKYQYFVEDDKVTFIDTTVGYGTVNTVASPPSTGSGHYFTDICSNGEFVFVACGTNGIYYWPVGDSSTSGTHYAVCTGAWTTITKVAWAADALWASGNQYLFVFGTSAAVPTGRASINGNAGTFTAGNITSAQVIPTVVGVNWRWTNLVEGNSQIYVGGSNGAGHSDGAVYRISQVLSQALSAATYSTTTTFAAPVKSLQLPSGEYPTALFSYLNYIFIGTSAGVRMCETLNVYDPTATGTGDLKSGTYVPNILQPVTSPVTSFTSNGRFVWFAWCNYDTNSTGLGRLDIQTFIDDLTPAYASDLMVGSTWNGAVQSTTLNLTWDLIQNAPLISVSAATAGTNGTYSKDSANVVRTGTVNSGWLTYDVPDSKMLTTFQPDVVASAGSITAAVMTDKGSGVFTAFQTIATQSSAANSIGQKQSLAPMISGLKFQVQITLGRLSGVAGPILDRWTLQAYCQVASETMLSPVIQLFRKVTVGDRQLLYDPYFEYMRLEALRRSKTPITYIEGPISALCTVDSIDWLPEKLQPSNLKGYNAVAVVYLKTINGFIYTPLPTSP